MKKINIYDTRKRVDFPLYVAAVDAVQMDGRRRIRSGSDAVEILERAFQMRSLTEERVVMLCLDTVGKPLGMFCVAFGALSWCSVRMADVFKKALAINAASIIVAHNHPSGDITPSGHDITFTQHLAVAGALIGLTVLDHIIIGTQAGDCNDYYSFRETSSQFFETAEQKAATLVAEGDI